MTQQANSTVDEGADSLKYEVGTRLRFVGYNPEELYPAAPGVEFQPGDILIVDEHNGCGMGIDVERESDGARDMVWPEEVEIIGP